MNDSTTHLQEGADEAQESDARKFDDQKAMAAEWFASLRDSICATFESIEAECPESLQDGLESGRFERKAWDRDGGGGGVMSVMHGRVFEKVG